MIKDEWGFLEVLVDEVLYALSNQTAIRNASVALNFDIRGIAKQRLNSYRYNIQISFSASDFDNEELVANKLAEKVCKLHSLNPQFIKARIYHNDDNVIVDLYIHDKVFQNDKVAIRARKLITLRSVVETQLSSIFEEVSVEKYLLNNVSSRNYQLNLPGFNKLTKLQRNEIKRTIKRLFRERKLICTFFEPTMVQRLRNEMAIEVKPLVL